MNKRGTHKALPAALAAVLQAFCSCAGCYPASISSRAGCCPANMLQLRWLLSCKHTSAAGAPTLRSAWLALRMPSTWVKNTNSSCKHSGVAQH